MTYRDKESLINALGPHQQTLFPMSDTRFI